MNAFRTTAVVERGNSLKLKSLPFRTGDHVEIIILECAPDEKPTKLTALRGSVKKYERPFDPVSENDWEANS